MDTATAAQRTTDEPCITTPAAALEESRRRWGPTGHAIGPGYEPLGRPWPEHEVGYTIPSRIQGMTRRICCGLGNSWDAAFADADRRAGAPS